MNGSSRSVDLFIAGLVLFCICLENTGIAAETQVVPPNHNSKLRPSANSFGSFKQLTQEQVRSAFTIAENASGGDPVRYYSALRKALNFIDVQNNALDSNTKTTPQSISNFVADHGSDIFQATNVSAEFTRSLKAFGNRNEIMIIGGEPTPLNEFDNCVAVGSSVEWCGSGVLISSNVVLTAAHCYPMCASRVFVGKNVNGRGKILDVAYFAQHPQYNFLTHSNDIAIIILKGFAPVAPATIASENILNTAVNFRLVGYGNTNSSGSVGYGIQRMVDVPPIPNSCLTLEQQSEYECNLGTEIIAGAPLLLRDACGGDSGGPAYVSTNGQWYVGGTTSRKTANSPELCGNFSAYVRLHSYLPWIRKVTSEHGGVSP